MTSANLKLRTFAANMRIITGLTGGDVGTVPDEAHMDPPAGYHVSASGIRAAGRWDVDYSTRQARDRTHPDSDDCRAFDIGDNWPHGGRAAWLRWNNMFQHQLAIADPVLAPIRAINFSPDGTLRRRYDTLHRDQGIISSTDTVTIHTHTEIWTDKINSADLDPALRRIEQMARAAIANIPLEDQMAIDPAGDFTKPLTQGNPGYAGQARDTGIAFGWSAAQTASANTASLLAGQAAASAKLDAILSDVAGFDAEQLSEIEARAKIGAAAALAEAREGYASAIVAALPPAGGGSGDSGELTPADVEAAVRAVFADAATA